MKMHVTRVYFATKDSFKGKSELCTTNTRNINPRVLLETKSSFPGDFLFYDDLFEATYAVVRHKKEASCP